jgi:hypothetical protein
MAYVLIRHKIEDFAKWKTAFDEHADVRREFGGRECKVFRSAVNQNEVFLLSEWDDLDRAKQFADSQDFKQFLPVAGVVTIPPDFFFLEEPGQIEEAPATTEQAQTTGASPSENQTQAA